MLAWCWIVALLAISARLQRFEAAGSKIQAIDNGHSSLELKFQTELDSSTVIKQLEQQQVFKCQVRLAPAASGTNSAPRARFKSNSKILDENPVALDGNNDWEQATFIGAQLNVTRLTIEWLKDDRLLTDDQLESVAVVNVTLARGEQANNKQLAPQVKTRRSRLEIKNTLNGGQLKLTSRLRISRVKAIDAGQYKCLAKTTFVQRQQQQQQQLVQFNQMLESNSTGLVVASSTTSPEPNAAREHQWNGQGKKWTPTSATGEAATPATHQQRAKGSPYSSGLEEMKHGDIQAPTNQLDGLGDTLRAGGNPNGAGGAWNLFEDDEDLFRGEPSERAGGELINGLQQQPSLGLGLANEENNDNTNNQEQMIEFSDNGELLSPPSVDGSGAMAGGGANRQRPSHESDVYLDWVLQQQQRQQQEATGRFMADTALESGPPGSGVAATGEVGTTLKGKPANTNDDRGQQHRNDHHQRQPNNQVTSFLRNQQGELGGSSLLSKSKLAKLVHKIAPELSCYTGVGEYYHGHIATALDQRPCLNWLHVRLALARQSADGVSSSNRSATQLLEAPGYATRLDNHNACRNPNSDARGPWCFVAHSEQLDGLIINRQAIIATASVAPPSGQPLRLTTHKQRAVWLGAHGQLFVIRPCAIASCSEYLWLYVVAPPLGLLVLLTCLASIAIRAIRKSHYNAIFSAAYQRHSNNGHANTKTAVSSIGTRSPTLVGRLITRRLGRALGSRNKRRNCFLNSGNKSSGVASKKANYLDGDDIFEIVDDIDWSDGQTPTSSAAHSMASPKTSESFRLNAATFNHSPTHHRHQNQGKSTLSHSKSINPVFSERQLTAAGEPPQPPPRLASNMGRSTLSKSKSQAGPMFATLRCQVRNGQNKRSGEANNKCLQQIKLGENNYQVPQTNTGNWLDASITSNLSSLQADDSASERVVKTGHLISCSTSSSSSAGISNAFASCSNSDSSGNTNGGGELILARDLPQLDPTSVTITHETQPIYEGKFSHVQWAYLKQRDNDAAQATGRIGAQVAVCGLKQQAALDEGTFRADSLRLRNLNHLNVLKIIGYVQYANQEQQQVPCALVYDMAHLMDLSDWLKEQSKESMIGRGDESTGVLSLRQNLACLAKQIALAVDYLHDKQIIYKDLACRNCFLDVTRMLVKLATFNIEPEFDTATPSSEYDVPQQQQQQQQPRAARKCADAKVGATFASASSDPSTNAITTTNNNNNATTTNDDINKRLNLKSMVRPKYLLDYYVIDSRPSECQMLPLSWIPLESILFNKFNRQTDIWSFGCLLYELFSLGEVAYFGYSSKQVIDSVRSNLMPPQPMLCPNGIYKLMCKCLSDIPTLRPNIKHIYEQLNLYSGQCSSFLNHHLCMI